MIVDVIDFSGKKVKELELPKDIFEAPINVGLMHQAYVRQLANARLGTHDTKTRADVSGGGCKPWRQKGTGRARQGSIRAPQWVGGGKVHTPHPRSYKQKMPLKMRKAALRSALSAKAKEKSIIVVEEIQLKEAKTKILSTALNKWIGKQSALIVMPDKKQENLFISARNIPSVKVLMSNYLNIRDIFTYNRLILDASTLKGIQQLLGKGK